MVVIAIIGLLSSITLSSLITARFKSRDSVRYQDLRQIQTALELYYTDKGYYPKTDTGYNPATPETLHYGCETWAVGNRSMDMFPGQLGSQYYPGSGPKDLTRTGNCAGYFYFRYQDGWGIYCNQKTFYVLGTNSLESIAANAADPKSPGFSCPASEGTARNWQTEVNVQGFQWVTGKFEN
jgi:type II secretory pathway pseudopilin PulG